MISAHCNLHLPASSDSPVSTSRVAGTTGTCHHAWMIFVFLVEMLFHHVGQVGFKLLTLWSARPGLPKCWDNRCVPPLCPAFSFLFSFFFFLRRSPALSPGLESSGDLVSPQPLLPRFKRLSCLSLWSVCFDWIHPTVLEILQDSCLLDEIYQWLAMDR